MTVANALYAQSGGVTAVINATACGLIQAARRFPLEIGTVFAARNGLLGVLSEDLFDTAAWSAETLQRIRQSPGGVFGSGRYPILDRITHGEDYQRLLAVLAAHDIRFLFYNGGNGSMETLFQIDRMAEEMGYPLQCIGIPKTIDNDLEGTDTCPGFGSAAKYVATSVREVGLDLAAMCRTSTQVYVLEVMGRHTGWLAAASGLAARFPGDAPHLIVFPEVPFDVGAFEANVSASVRDHGFCVVVAAEGVRVSEWENTADSVREGVHTHGQPGRIGAQLSGFVAHMGFRSHWSLLGYLQRSAGHLISGTDQQQAAALGEAALTLARSGRSALLPVIERVSDCPYVWGVGETDLASVAGLERKLPADFISSSGFGITAAARRYLQPLIEGEVWPNYVQGLPDYPVQDLPSIERRLSAWMPPYARGSDV